MKRQLITNNDLCKRRKTHNNNKLCIKCDEEITWNIIIDLICLKCQETYSKELVDVLIKNTKLFKPIIGRWISRKYLMPYGCRLATLRCYCLRCNTMITNIFNGWSYAGCTKCSIIVDKIFNHNYRALNHPNNILDSFLYFSELITFVLAIRHNNLLVEDIINYLIYNIFFVY